jgi:hypothetical protein
LISQHNPANSIDDEETTERRSDNRSRLVEERRRLRRHWGAGLSVVAGLIIAAATLIPGGHAPSPPVTCVVCDEFALTDFIANIGLFAPLGVGLAWFGFRGRTTVALAFAATTTIELLQRWVIPGRDPSIRDVVANTLGAAAGWLLAQSIATALSPSSRTARRLTVAAVLSWLIIESFGARLETLSLPMADYWGQWAPELGNMRHFDGRLVDARVNGQVLPSGRIRNTQLLRDQLHADGLSVQAIVISDRREEVLAPIVAIYDRATRQVFLLGEAGHNTVFYVRRWAADLRLRNPGIAVHNDIQLGDTVEYAGGFSRGRLFVRSRDAAKLVTADVPVGAWLLWSHLVPFRMELGRFAMLISAIWSALLLVPMGFWGWKANASRRVTFAVLGAVVTLGLTLIPIAFGQPIAPPGIWFASGAGLLAGIVAARRWAWSWFEPDLAREPG